MKAAGGQVIPISRNRAVHSPEEAARLLGLSKGTIYTWLRNGVLPGIKAGGRWGIPKRQLEEWLDSLTVESEPAPEPAQEEDQR